MNRLKWLMFMASIPFAAVSSDNQYVVIDLSGGTNATSYDVSYLDAVPEGGWTDTYKTTKLVLKCIPAGSFWMGSSSSDKSAEQPVHQVTISKPFYMGIFEVTQKQWKLVMGSNPSNFIYDTRPVDKVSWDDIRSDSTSFVSNLVSRTGLSFDLPTEAQWEYACRAGTTTAYSYGDSPDENYMWYFDNSSASTHPVGTKLPNAWGLYDMHGNLWEWCLDRYGSYESTAVVDPVGPSSGSYRVLRGGCWDYPADCCTSSVRTSYPSRQLSYFGFRLSCLAESDQSRATITYNANGGSCAVTTQSVVKGCKLAELPTPELSGFSFVGWFTAAEGGKQISVDTVVEDDITLIAHWLSLKIDYMVVNGTTVIGNGEDMAVNAAYSGELTLPSLLGAYQVTKIASSAFEKCTRLTSVKIPDSVVEIGNSAFERCYSLTNITIPASVTNIGYCAFRDCFRLAEVKFLGARPHIELGAFMGIPAYAVVSSKSGSVTAVLPTEVTGDVVSVPTGWLDQIATRHRGDTPAGYSSYEAAFTAKFGSDLAKALVKQTGKHDTQGNVMMVWQDFVAGTDPLDEEDVFSATVSLENGVPVVRWSPELSASEAAQRNYKTFAKTALNVADWTDVTNLSDEDRQAGGYQFFKVTVEMK